MKQKARTGLADLKRKFPLWVTHKRMTPITGAIKGYRLGYSPSGGRESLNMRQPEIMELMIDWRDMISSRMAA